MEITYFVARKNVPVVYPLTYVNIHVPTQVLRLVRSCALHIYIVVYTATSIFNSHYIITLVHPYSCIVRITSLLFHSHYIITLHTVITSLLRTPVSGISCVGTKPACVGWRSQPVLAFVCPTNFHFHCSQYMYTVGMQCSKYM